LWLIVSCNQRFSVQTAKKISSAGKGFENSAHGQLSGGTPSTSTMAELSQSRLSVIKLIIFTIIFIILISSYSLDQANNIMTVSYDGNNYAENTPQHAFLSIWKVTCSFYSLYFLFIKPLFEHDHPCSEMWPCQQKTLRTIFRARPSLVEWWCNFIHR